MRFLIIALVFVADLIFTLAHPSTRDKEGKRLIQTSETETRWLTEKEINTLILNRKHFVDITENRWRPSPEKYLPRTMTIPDVIRFQSIVESAFTKFDIERMRAFISEFSSYNNRFYTTTTGIASSEWLLSKIQNLVVDSGRGATVETVTHSWRQISLVARIQGTHEFLQEEVVIFGAHLDSLNLRGPSTLNSPGADDNGSGSVVLLETLGALLRTGFRPKRTIEFHWYAAEEVGLKGSQAVAEIYYNRSVNVVAMVNFDVVGYGTEKEVGIIQDYTSRDLSEFLVLAVNEYLDYAPREFRCGYGCSDHASWNSFGYPAAMPVEVHFNPYMHTTRDTIDKINFEMVSEFCKLAAATAIELAEPNPPGCFKRLN